MHKVARRILRSIGLPTDRNHDQLVVAALRELTPDQRREATGEILRRYKPDLLILRRRGGPLQRSERPARIGGPDL